MKTHSTTEAADVEYYKFKPSPVPKGWRQKHTVCAWRGDKLFIPAGAAGLSDLEALLCLGFDGEECHHFCGTVLVPEEWARREKPENMHIYDLIRARALAVQGAPTPDTRKPVLKGAPVSRPKPTPEEEELLSRARMCTIGRNTKMGIIRGSRPNTFITEEHTIVTGNNDDRRIHRLMDNLYDVYKLEPHTIPGIAQKPWIETLRFNKLSEFHVYSGEAGVTKGFFVSFVHRFEESFSVATMTFVWVAPRFRRQGLFTRMYRELVERRGPVFVDDPNADCEKALDSIGYSRAAVISYYDNPPPGAKLLPAMEPDDREL